MTPNPSRSSGDTHLLTPPATDAGARLRHSMEPGGLLVTAEPVTTATVSFTTTQDASRQCLQLRGEVDVSSLPLLDRVLGPLFDGDGDVHLDVSGLTFIDVAGVRALAMAALQLRADGRHLVLTRSNAHLQRVAALLGWAALFGP